MLKAHFDQLAAYNRWANRRIYDDAASLDDAVRNVVGSRSIGAWTCFTRIISSADAPYSAAAAT